MQHCYSNKFFVVKGWVGPAVGYVVGMARAAPASTRAANIVSFLTAHPSRGFTISEFVEHLGMNIASAHATLAVLSDCGFVLRDPVHRTYVLGPALAATGFAALEQHPAIGAAIEQAELLAAELAAEVAVSAIAGKDVIYLARRGPAGSAQHIGYPGDRSPLLAPIGGIFLAWSGATVIDDWLDRAAVTPLLASFYRRVLAEIRSRGFSVPLPAIAAPAVIEAMSRLREEPTDEDREQSLTEALKKTDEALLLFEGMAPTDEIRVKTVAAPIFDPIGRVLLSLSVTGPDHPMRVADVLDLGARLSRAAAIATRQARGRSPGDDLPRTAGGAGPRRRRG